MRAMGGTLAARETLTMAKNEKTGKAAARAASKVLRDPKSTAAEKRAAASALTQAPDRKPRRKK